jgi:hypothetical protein
LTYKEYKIDIYYWKSKESSFQGIVYIPLSIFHLDIWISVYMDHIAILFGASEIPEFWTLKISKISDHHDINYKSVSIIPESSISSPINNIIMILDDKIFEVKSVYDTGIV